MHVPQIHVIFLLDLGQHMTKIIYVHTIERPRVA